MFILLFVMACHMIAHRFAIPPRMHFRMKGFGFGEGDLADAHVHGRLGQSQPNSPPVERSSGWSGFWERQDDAPNFVVTEPMRPVEDTIDALPNRA